MAQMTENQWRIGHCESCLFEDIKVKKFRREAGLPADKLPGMALCELCAGSYAGIARDFNYSDMRLAGLVCYVGNTILQELRKGRQE